MPWERELYGTAYVYSQSHEWGWIRLEYDRYAIVWYGLVFHNNKLHVPKKFGTSVDVLMCSLEEIMMQLGLQ